MAPNGSSFIAALTPGVPLRTRAKGTGYYRNGAVIDIRGGPWAAHAVVRGTQDYRVELVRDGDLFTGSCECPWFVDRMEMCKHIWAALLEAESRGLLGGEGTDEAPTDFEAAFIDPGERPSAKVIPMPGRPPSRPPAWQQFLTELKQDVAAGERALPQPRFSNGQIVYAIDVRETRAGMGTVVNVLFRQRKKNGEWSKPRQTGVTPHEAELLLDNQDREIISLLLGAASVWLSPSPGAFDAGYPRLSRYVLNGPLEDRLLPMLVRTGRAYLQRVDEGDGLLPIAMDEGPTWRFELRITSPDPESVLVDGYFRRGDERMELRQPVLVLSRGWLFTRTSMARLDLEGGFAWIARLRSYGPTAIPREQAPSLVEALARSGLPPQLLPEDLRYEVVDAVPRPMIRVSRPTRPNPFAFRQDLRANLQFDYGGTIVEAPPGATAYDAESRRLVRRDRVAEQAAIDRLHQLGFRYTWSHFESRQVLGISPEQFPRVVHALVKEGWRVEADGRAFRGAVGMRLSVSSGIDWFDLHGDVDFGEGRSAPFPQLLAALSRGENVVVLDDGSVGLLPEEWLKRYASVAAFGREEGTAIRFGKNQASLLDALLAAQPAISYDEVFARMRAELGGFRGITPAQPPPTFHGQLRGYQEEALGWFEFLRRFGFGGCLADDMGLGKTVMVLALLEARRHGRGSGPGTPSLAVVPRSLVFNWKDEAARFAPELRVADYTGPQRDLAVVNDADLVLTTYGTLRRDAPDLREVEFDYVILDEAQAIKNAATASAKAARLLRGRHRLALSGTPIENHLGELWSLFEFLNPGLLGTSRAFQQAQAGRAKDGEEIEWLARALRPFILRRTKEQVAPELPPRTEQTIHCELEGAQRRQYDELRAHYRESLLKRVAREGMSKSKMHILEALLRLRQAACHPGLIDPRRASESSAKFDLLLPLLKEVVEEGHKALVFSQFTSLLGLLRPRIGDAGIEHEYLDGRTRDRAQRVERFQNDPGCSVFLISLKAGGLGLNLTAAEYVFLLDPWWNPAVEAQAIDRAHRIGQTSHVFAYRLLARDTVEEKVAELQQSKRDLADAILRADASLVRSLSAEDLEMLLS